MDRRQFIWSAGSAAGFALIGSGCGTFANVSGRRAYSVAILGDTHYDAEPESVYHSHYDESNRWAQIQHAEFRRNGEMWRERCPRMLESSAALARERPTDFVLQLGDIIQGDCDDVDTHKKMLADCIALLRRPYPEGLPFFTVVGNHDFRGKGARPAYFEFAEPFMSRESGADCRYPAFAFRRNGDLWIFCDFETKDLSPIIELVESGRDARYTFLVTHGPFTATDGNSWRWRLGGRKDCDALRPALYDALSRRRAIVLSGHTHTTTYWRHENALGGFTEFIANSVWASEDLATGEPLLSTVAEYGTLGEKNHTGEKLAEYRRDLDFFRPGLKEYFHSPAAGHSRLDVSDAGVTVSFHPGDARIPARVFKMA